MDTRAGGGSLWLVNPLWQSAAVVLCSCGVYSGQVAISTNWYVITSPVTNDLNGLAYGYENGFVPPGSQVFVAGGGQGTILTSSNGSNWTASYPGGNAPTYFCAAYAVSEHFGEPYLVGGSGAFLLLASADGLNWTNVLSGANSQQINSIAGPIGSYVNAVAIGWDDSIGKSYVVFPS